MGDVEQLHDRLPALFDRFAPAFGGSRWRELPEPAQQTVRAAVAQLLHEPRHGERVYSVQELAKEYKVHDDVFYKAIKSGQLRAKKCGREWRIRESDFEVYWRDGAGQMERRGAHRNGLRSREVMRLHA